jgi:uncharacterized protein
MAAVNGPGAVGRAFASRPLAPALPVYRWDEPDWVMLYSPGCLAVATTAAADAIAARLRSGSSVPAGDSLAAAARTLRQSAESAVAAASRQTGQEYRPLCLTLYLTQACNLACTYCYAGAGPSAAPLRLLPAEIDAAAAMVAANCAAAGRPLTVVCHGGGEPTRDAALLREALAIARLRAQEAGCALFTYVATNGCVDEAMAQWLADSFDLVGLSCDGPPAIQDCQRPLAGGGPTAALVARTAGTLRRAGRPFHVRCTITAATMARQAEIAEYVATELRPTEMHFEPTYHGGRQVGAAFDDSPAAAEGYVQGYLEALAVADRLATPLHSSGVRLGEVHGPFCQVSRQVLNLVPGEDGGVATACFRHSTAALAREAGMVVGGLNAAGEFRLDEWRIATVRRALALPDRCQGCFNRFHCAGDCPDRCRVEPGAAPRFRCLSQQGLAFALLRRRGAALAATTAHAMKEIGVCLTTNLP